MIFEPITSAARMRGRNDPITSIIRYGVAWTVVVFAPLMLYDLLGITEAFIDPTMINTGVAATVALFFGMYLAGRVLDLPGTRGTVHGVPIMWTSFIIAVIVMFALRTDYSRVMFGYSAAVSTLIAMQLRWSNRTMRQQPFYLVPFGKAMLMEEIEGFPVRRLSRPEIPNDRAANIVADFRADLPDEWERLLAQASLAGVPVYHYKQLTESLTGQVKIEHLSENSLGSLVPNQSYTPVKRLVDIIGSLAAIALTLPVMFALALAIWLEDRDSPFFVQSRTGMGGKPFRMYKFRSMSNRAAPECDDSAREDAITKSEDARVTRIGKFIRKFRLDELPQLFNVLKGEMSLIGPRPEANALAEWYEDNLAFYSYRNIVKPGLTGWAQVNQGHVATLEDIDIKLQYDFYYIKYFSFWLDVLIVMRTIHTIATGFGSK
ncbi:sugar transferase [Erythrobacter sp. JK5]|uniref:sugar transferase n=1 Tax=Erythrobacter sp. JK5 TaxID=2829500 RepID=UPI001BA63FB4|nr:sugar transferase [Erythrobacter sp. JK5]QUL37353.1 sugar transferase [Erythrobacter sp. JK5]